MWVDPSNPDTWRYILDVARAAGAAGFDEVDLADVRFPSEPDDATAVYARPKAPRTRVIAEFLRQAADELHADGVRLSVEALGLAATKDLGVGQDPVLIKQIADVISPTLFPTGFAAWQLGIADPGANPHDTVLQALIDWRHTLVNGGAELRPWLQDFSTSTRTYGAREVAAQVAAVRDAGADGYLLANPDGALLRARRRLTSRAVGARTAAGALRAPRRAAVVVAPAAAHAHAQVEHHLAADQPLDLGARAGADGADHPALLADEDALLRLRLDEDRRLDPAGPPARRVLRPPRPARPRRAAPPRA